MDRQLDKSREKVKYGEDRAAAKCVEYFVDAGNCDLWDLGNRVQVLVVNVDSDVARRFGDAYQGARLRRSGMLNEASSNVVIKDDVDLF